MLSDMAARTPAERERMYALLWEKLKHPYGGPWASGRSGWAGERAEFDRLLAAFPQLWDSLPPDPAEQARKEAEEDRDRVEAWRRAKDRGFVSLDAHHVLDLIDRMVARAEAGYLVIGKGTDNRSANGEGA